MNIRQVRKKIKSVNNVKKITKAMQLVSAVKMRKAQLLAIEGRPYQLELSKILDKILGNLDPKYSKLMIPKKTPNPRKLAIIISTNKGLCGSYNFNLFRFILKNIDIKNTHYITIGKKGSVLMYRTGGTILADYSNIPPLTTVSAVFEQCLKSFIEGTYSEIALYYNSFVSILSFEPTKLVLLPFSYKQQEVNQNKREYVVEPNPEVIIDSLLRSFVEEKIRNALIEHEAGEHSARMMAMKNATDSANDVVYNLTLLRNKLRQDKITYELLDMITAKESVEIG